MELIISLRELLNLKLKDINLDRGYIRVTAKNKERIVPLNDTVKGFLEDYFFFPFPFDFIDFPLLLGGL